MRHVHTVRAHLGRQPPLCCIWSITKSRVRAPAPGSPPCAGYAIARLRERARIGRRHTRGDPGLRVPARWRQTTPYTPQEPACCPSDPRRECRKKGASREERTEQEGDAGPADGRTLLAPASLIVLLSMIFFAQRAGKYRPSPLGHGRDSAASRSCPAASPAGIPAARWLNCRTISSATCAALGARTPRASSEACARRRSRARRSASRPASAFGSRGGRAMLWCRRRGASTSERSEARRTTN